MSVSGREVESLGRKIKLPDLSPWRVTLLRNSPSGTRSSVALEREGCMWLLFARCLGLPTGLIVCSGRGSLMPNGGCACHAGWSGPSCARQGCKRECSGRGVCLAGLCSCEPGWRGDDCGRRPVPAVIECPHSCWGRGMCDFANGRCHCMQGYGGDDCSAGLCPRDCSGHGICVDGTQPVLSAVRGFASNSTAGRSYLAGGC